MFHKNSIHPTILTAQENEASELHLKHSQIHFKKDEIYIVPFINEFNYFERKLHLYRGYSSVLEPLADLQSIKVKRIYRNQNEDAIAEEPIKYEISTTSGFLIYFVSEQAGSFIKRVNCCSKLEKKELNIMTVGDNTGIKYQLEFGYTGHCKKILTILNNRELGTTQIVFSLLSWHKQIIRVDKRQERFLIKSKNQELCKIPFSTFETEEYEISYGKGGFSKGEIKLSPNNEISHILLLFHGLDPVGKLLLISALILIDLRRTSRRNTTRKCDIFVLVLQFMASMCFYTTLLSIFTVFVFLILF